MREIISFVGNTSCQFEDILVFIYVIVWPRSSNSVRHIHNCMIIWWDAKSQNISYVFVFHNALTCPSRHGEFEYIVTCVLLGLPLLWKIQLWHGKVTAIMIFRRKSLSIRAPLSTTNNHFWHIDIYAIKHPCHTLSLTVLVKWFLAVYPPIGMDPLRTWINFNPHMEKSLHPLLCVGWNYLSFPKLQRLHNWSLGMNN